MQDQKLDKNPRLPNKKTPEKNVDIINEQIAIGEATGLGYREIIEAIKSQGIKISVAQYYVYKEKFLDLNNERLLNMGTEWKSEYLQRINTQKQVEKVLWEMVRTTEDEKVRLGALKHISDLQPQLQIFYNSAPIVNGMFEALKNEARGTTTTPALEARSST